MKLMNSILLIFPFLFLTPVLSNALNPNELHISELEKEVHNLREVVSYQKDEINYLKTEIKNKKNIIIDYNRAKDGYAWLAKVKESCDEGECINDPFGQGSYNYENFLNRTVEKANIVLSNGKKFENYYTLEAYVKRIEKDLPDTKQDIRNLSKELKKSQKEYTETKREYDAYVTVYLDRMSRLAIEGFWQFQGYKTILKIIYTSKRYNAIVSKDHLDKFSKGDVLFYLNKADLWEDPYFYTGKEYGWGKSYFDRLGKNPTTLSIRVHIKDIHSNRMSYKSRDDSLILKKIAPLK